MLATSPPKNAIKNISDIENDDQKLIICQKIVRSLEHLGFPTLNDSDLWLST
jgi:hypothetical protein